MLKSLPIKLLLLAGVLFTLSGVYAQATFQTGSIAVTLANYGEIEVFSPDSNTYQIDRSSLLVATTPTDVFDYAEDAENVMPPTVVASPAQSDFELRNYCDNSFSNQPPDILEKIFIYGWSGGSYVVGKIRVTNTAATEVFAINGLEILPQIDDAYGFEIVEYLASQEVVSIYKSSGTYVGYKFFNPSLTSLRAFEWYSGYNDLDDSLYSYLTHGTIDPMYASGADGSVAVMGQEGVQIAPGDSVEFYFGISVGADEAAMLSNMDAAFSAYQGLITGISRQDPALPLQFKLSQNYPNPFNPATKIDFQIPHKEDVKLVVYNILGEEVATLVNRSLEAGKYSYDFQAGRLPSGVYFYTLAAGNFNETRKMILLR